MAPVSSSSDEDRIRKKKPKSKFKTESNKRRRHRRRHSSLSSFSSSSSSSDSESDHYSSRKREKPKKKRRKKEKELAKSDKRKSQKKKKNKKKKRHDTPSASSSSPVRRHKSRKRRRSPSPSPSCSTCSSRGRSPARDGHREGRLPKSPDATEERWEERDKVIEAYDDYQSSRNDEREADAAGNYELGKTRLGGVVQSVNGDMVVMAEEKEKSIGVGNARLASVVGSVNYDMAVEEEEKSAGSGDSAGKDAVDLELILRQRALENLRKFRGGLSAIKESDKPAVDSRIGSSDEGGSIPNQPIKEHGYTDIKSLGHSQSGLSANKGLVGNRVAASSIDVGITTNQVKKVQESTNRMVLSEQTTCAKVAQGKKLVAEPGSGKVHRSEVSVADKNEDVKLAKEGDFQNPNSTETPKPTVSRTFSKPIEGGSKQNEAKLEESSKKLLSEQAMLAKDKTLVTEIGRDKAHTGSASIGDGSPVSCPIKDDENCKSNEPMVNSATGSEFEQKTFCRVRDGETVQVKYKVYIPKKTPALARRKLQR